MLFGFSGLTATEGSTSELTKSVPACAPLHPGANDDAGEMRSRPAGGGGGAGVGAGGGVGAGAGDPPPPPHDASKARPKMNVACVNLACVSAACGAGEQAGEGVGE